MDLGCGTGASTLLAAAPAQGQTWFALDADRDSLAIASRCFADFPVPGALFLPVLARLEMLPFREGPVRVADVVMANPPYIPMGDGRTPSSGGRRDWGHGDRSVLATFARAASLLLKDGGSYHFVVPPRRLVNGLLAARAFGLATAVIQPIGPSTGACRLVRITCQNRVQRELSLEAQLSVEDLLDRVR